MYTAIVIDDEKWVVKSLIATIEDQSWFSITQTFYDGMSGLEYLRSHKPDLAFIDVRLPDISGLEILKAAHEENIPTLFIIISGHAEFAYAQKALLHNAISYCLKPFSKSELMDSMQKAWDILQDNKSRKRAIEVLTRNTQNIDHTEAETLPKEKSSYHPEHMTSPHKTVQTIVDYIEKNYRNDFSIQELADSCGINANYASQLFHQKTGMTPVQYIRRLRIRYASWLQVHTNETVFTISDEAGYSNYFYFAKIFKKDVGKTPTQYRADHNQGENE